MTLLEFYIKLVLAGILTCWFAVACLVCWALFGRK